MTTSGNLLTGRLRIGDQDRSFTLHKPLGAGAGAGAGAGELPLVIVLHGHSPDASGAMMRAWTSFDAHADEWGIAVAYPDGYRGGWADGRGVTAADADGVKVATLTVHGGGHTWPGAAPVADPQAAAAIGPTAQNLDAATEIVRFACPPLDARARRR